MYEVFSLLDKVALLFSSEDRTVRRNVNCKEAAQNWHSTTGAALNLFWCHEFHLVWRTASSPFTTPHLRQISFFMCDQFRAGFQSTWGLYLKSAWACLANVLDTSFSLATEPVVVKSDERERKKQILDMDRERECERDRQTDWPTDRQTESECTSALCVGVGLPGAGAAGGCEPPSVDAENPTQVSGRSTSGFTCGAITHSSHLICLNSRMSDWTWPFLRGGVNVGEQQTDLQ